MARKSTNPMSVRQSIVAVLAERGKPMKVRQIIDAGLPLATGLKGKTPGQTFYSILYAEAKKADGIVKQTSKGTFKLNPKARTVGERKPAVKAEAVGATPDPKPSKNARKRRTRAQVAA